MVAKAKTLKDWKDGVLTVQEYLDEDYEIDTWGIGTVKNFKNLQLGWGRMIIDKFIGRMILVISGGTATRACESDLLLWIRQAVEFGNASMIVSDDGRIRIPSPTTSFAQKTEDGSIFFREMIGENLLWGWNEQLYYRQEKTENDQPIEDAQIFTLFYNESNMQPYGQSRLTRSTMWLTRYGSRLLYFAETVSATQSHRQLIFSNVNQDIMQAYQNGTLKDENQVRSIKMGIHDALMIGEGDNGETKVSTIDPNKPDGLLAHFNVIAAQVAVAHNIEPREFGLLQAVAPSAEAQSEAHRGLILEVSQFSKKISRTVLAALVAVAEANGEQLPELFWVDPEITSQGAAIDALQKKQATTGWAIYLKSSLMRGGLSPEEIAEAEARGYLGVGQLAPANPIVEVDENVETV